jgi:two-component system response regulator AlgR
LKLLIVDDEPLARSRLCRLIEQQEGFEVVAEAENGQQALASLHHQPDIILMDIRMPVMDGLTAARSIADSDDPPVVIFCTAYDDYALEAFEANAVDYLLKPVSRDKLRQSLDKASRLNKLQLSALTESIGEQRSHISAKTPRGIELVALDDVRYFRADLKYVTVFHSGGELLIDEPLKELEQEFGPRFVRVHRNALVAAAYTQGLEKTDEGYRVKLDGIAEGPLVSRRHLPELRKLLQSL